MKSNLSPEPALLAEDRSLLKVYGGGPVGWVRLRGRRRRDARSFQSGRRAAGPLGFSARRPSRRGGDDRRVNADQGRRGGAVIIIVLSLMAALTFLGFFFYEFTVLERNSAESFANSTPVQFDPDPIADAALEQLIVGTRTGFEDSALWGNKYSLLANLIGRISPDGLVPDDVNPHTGTGIEVFSRDENTESYFGTNPMTMVGTPDRRPDLFGNSALIHDQVDFRYLNPLTNEVHLRRFGDQLVPLTSPPTGLTFVDGPPVFNFSRAADPDLDGDNIRFDAFSVPVATGTTPFPQLPIPNYLPDAGYTYPDASSMFLSYESEYVDPRDGEVFNIYTPSFFRPQYFEDRRSLTGETQVSPAVSDSRTVPASDGFADVFVQLPANATAPADFVEDTRQMVLRPHAGHHSRNATFPRFVFGADYDGTMTGLGFALTDLQARSGDTTRVLRPFPFGVDLDGDGRVNELGIWSGTGRGNSHNPDLYELDVDNDGDGRRDGIWMDLDLPVIDFPDGRQAVPLISFKVVDADALLNLNVHGNDTGFVRNSVPSANMAIPTTPGSGPVPAEPRLTLPPTTIPFGFNPDGNQIESVSASSLGLSPAEVNFGWGLSAWDSADYASRFGAPTSALLPHDEVFGRLADSQLELSNMEMAMILHGGLSADGTARRSGRFGEADDAATVAGTTGRALAPADGQFPQPGYTYKNDLATPVDDDADGGQTPINAMVTGRAPYEPAKLNRDGGVPLSVTPQVHRLPLLGEVDPLTDAILPATPWSAGAPRVVRTLDLSPGLTAVTPPLVASGGPAVWPAYSHNQREWYSRLLTATPIPGSYYPGIHGVIPYENGALGVSVDTINVTNDLLRLVNEPDETTLDASFGGQGDSLFAPSEIEGLHLSDGDFGRVSVTSRLRELAPINFALDRNASSIRKRFTTESVDRLEFASAPSFGRNFTAAGLPVNFADNAEFNRWTISPAASPGPPLGLSSGDTVDDAFPPQFGTVGLPIQTFSPQDPFRRELRIALATALDSEYVAAMNVNGLAHRNLGEPEGQNGRFAARKKIRLDRILDAVADRLPNVVTPVSPSDREDGVDPLTGESTYRELVPHPDLSQPPFVSLPGPLTIPAMVHGVGTSPAVNFAQTHSPDPATRAVAQEWWARWDRQRLARDIYVLMYTLCGPDGWNPLTTDPATNPDAQNHVRYAAQFAVNLVDAIDRDSVMTEFFYDPDLSNGWDVDDTTAERAVGVEAQTLTLSEVVFARTARAGGQRSFTGWDDDQAHQGAVIELRNASPFPVQLTRNHFRLRVTYQVAGTTPGENVEIEFDDPDPTNPNDHKVIEAGENLFVADGTFATGYTAAEVNSEAVDVAGNSTDNVSLLPLTGTFVGGTFSATEPPLAPGRESPGIDLRSTDAGHTDFFTPTTTPSGTFPDFSVIVNGPDGMGDNETGQINYVVELHRRRNPLDPNNLTVQDMDDWIVVDRHEIQSADLLDLTMANTAADARDLIRQNWQGWEFAEPLGPVERHPVGAGGGGIETHVAHTAGFDPTIDFTIGLAAQHNPAVPGYMIPHRKNDALSGAAFTHWQWHFDRDLASASELLSVPLYSPLDAETSLSGGVLHGPGGAPVGGLMNDASERQEMLRHSLAPIGRTQRLLPGTPANLASPASMNDAGAGPNLFASMATDPTEVDHRNRWYRLFDFVSVPPRINGAVETFKEQNDAERYETRTPGRIDLNTLRDPEVLAALIDDRTHLDLFADRDNPADQRPDGTLIGRTIAGGANDADDRAGDAPPDATAAAVVSPTPFNGRNWWREFLIARDGVDPWAHIPLPGLPESRPFLPSSRLEDGNEAAGRDRSLLRRHSQFVPTTSGASPPLIGQTDDRAAAVNLLNLGLFEARNTADASNDAVDPWTRNRLLAKVMNNSTNRSNVFLVWMTIGLFECDHAPGDRDLVRIGGPLEGAPLYRTFAVVDRSRLEEGYIDPDTDDDEPGSLNFRQFIIHRRRLQ